MGYERNGFRFSNFCVQREGPPRNPSATPFSIFSRLTFNHTLFLFQLVRFRCESPGCRVLLPESDPKPRTGPSSTPFVCVPCGSHIGLATTYWTKINDDGREHAHADGKLCLESVTTYVPGDNEEAAFCFLCKDTVATLDLSNGKHDLDDLRCESCFFLLRAHLLTGFRESMIEQANKRKNNSRGNPSFSKKYKGASSSGASSSE